MVVKQKKDKSGFDLSLCLMTFQITNTQKNYKYIYLFLSYYITLKKKKKKEHIDLLEEKTYCKKVGILGVAIPGFWGFEIGKKRKKLSPSKTAPF